MTTEKFYQKDVYCRELPAVITDVRTEKNHSIITVDRTIFFPVGGGQNCDIGTMTTADGTVCEVVDVHEDKDTGEILHHLKGLAEDLHAGDSITETLDWENRRFNMQRHTGEHILTGSFIQLFGGANHGFHMGGDYVTIDMDYDGERLTWEQIREAERLANEIIWQNIPITVSFFPDKETASTMPTRKPVTQDGEITIVTIGDLENPFDACPCCGTHFTRTGEVGLIRIHKVEPNKGMNRIYFECGLRALTGMQEDDTLLQTVEERFSASAADLLHKMDVRDEKESDLRQEHAALIQYYKDNEQQRILSELQRNTPDFYTDTFTLVSPDDLLKLGFSLMEDTNAPELMALVHAPSCTVLLFSDGEKNCGNLIREIAKPLGGRGGGRPEQARALLPNEDAVQKFLAALEQ